jgi:hypothetical protein
MTTPTDERTVYLNDLPYRVRGVQRFPSSSQPAKIIAGDFNLDTHPLISIWSISDNRGGIGIDRMDMATDQGRCWYSTCNLRHKNHLTLGRLQNTNGSAPSEEIGVLVTSSISGTELVYGSFDTAIHNIAAGSPGAWGSAHTGTLNDPATDAKEGFVGTTQYLIFVDGSSIWHSTNGTSFTENTGESPKYIEFLNGLLWSIEADGDTFWSDNVTGAWNSAGKLLLPSGYVQGLFVAEFRHSGGLVEKLCASTKVGVFVYNTDHGRWDATDLKVPVHPDNGKAFAVWRGDIYYGHGLGVLRYTQTAASPTITPIGVDRDDGMPENKRGPVNKLIPSFNELIATVGFTGSVETQTSETDDITQTDGGSGTPAWSSLTNAESNNGTYATWVGDDSSDSGDIAAGAGVNVISQQPPWGNPGRVTASDNSYATEVLTGSGDTGDLLYSDAFNFSSIPDTAIIRGIEVKIHRLASVADAIKDELIQLTTDATSKFSVGNKAAAAFWPTSEATATYPEEDAETDLWGFSSLSVAEVKNAAFGLRIKVRSPSAAATASVDYVTIKIHYSALQNSDVLVATVNGDSGGSNLAVPAGVTITGIQVDIEKSAAAGDNGNVFQDVSVKLQKDDSTLISENKAETTTDWPSSDTVVTYGGSGDLWGASWSATEANDNELGVRIQIEGNNGNGSPQAKIDYVRITVYYQPLNGTIIAWDTAGWQVLAEGDTGAGPIDDALVSEENGNYRFFWAEDQDTSYIDLPRAVDHPSTTSNDQFAASGTYESMWFDAGAIHQDKLALVARVDSDHPTSSETIVVEYATDYDETYTTLVTKSASGETRYELPTTGSPIGVPFRAWKFRLTFARDAATTTNTPDHIRTALVYRRRNEDLRAWTFEVEIEDGFNGLDAETLVANLDAARTSATLVTFQTLDESSAPYYTQVLSYRQLSGTTHDFEGAYSITVSELIKA